MSVENSNLWKLCEGCFSSFPVANFGNEEPELWFTEEHKHDINAWNGTDNTLVNIDRRIADDRGTSYLIFNPANYAGKYTFIYRIASCVYIILFF